MTELDDAIADFTDGLGDHRVRVRRLAAAIIADARKPESPPPPAPPSAAAKAWRERMLEWVPLDRHTGRTEHEATKVVDEAVALITAAEQQADAYIRYERKTTDVAFARVNAERDAIQREVERSHRALNESVQRERDAVKRAEAAEKKLHGAEVRAEAAEFNFQSHVKSTLEARKERDDLRARLAKLLAATALYVQAIDTGFGPMGKSNEDLLFAMRNAIAEARSGATDAPPAATPARERLRQDVKRRETRCNGTFDDIQALLNEPAAADGWEAMRELRDTLQSRCNAMRAATENEYHDSTRAHCYAWANGLNEAMLEIDRLLSRSLANKHGAEV